MDLVKLIADKAVELAENGTLEEIVTKHVTASIDDIVKDCFKWSGEGKKALETAIKSKLELPLENLQISQYQKIISGLIETHLNNTAVESAKVDIIESVQKITGILEIKEIPLKTIIEKFIEEIDTSYHGGMDEQYSQITLIVDDERDDFIYIYFDEDANKDKYSCKNRIGLHHGKIFTVKFDNTDFSPFSINIGSGLEQYLFQLYANNCTILTEDVYYIETDYYREDYD